MAVHWFPGHMNAARKRAAETMAVTDLVVEVLDSRAPGASTNPMIETMRRERQRPCVKILNKKDLADEAVTKAWLDYYNAQPGVTAVAISCKNPSEVAKLPAVFRKAVPHRTGPGKPVRLMIMGVPNVGKSTLMNMLLKRRAAKTGDEPAVTKSEQRLYLGDDMVLTDTPGLMWPKIEHDSDGYMLAAAHAIGVNAVIEEEVAAFLGDVLLKRYPDDVAKRYKTDVGGLDGIALIEKIAARRGYRISGGEPDYTKASLALLDDFRKGAIGRVSLETPESRDAMVEADKAEAARKAAEKAAKEKEADA